MEEETPKRLCSEIQLFDLCDKDTCAYRDGRYCTERDILARFEDIKEEDEKESGQLMEENPEDEAEDSGDMEYGEYKDEEDEEACEEDI